MEELVRFSITMEADLLNRFDALVASRGTRANRSEAVRDLVRDALVENVVEDPEAPIAGTITMVFDHHASDLADKLNALQHQYLHEIISTVHVHLDARYCLEVIVLRGASARIRAIANVLLGTKGVKHGKLVTTSTVDGGPGTWAQEPGPGPEPGPELGHDHRHDHPQGPSEGHDEVPGDSHGHGHGHNPLQA